MKKACHKFQINIARKLHFWLADTFGSIPKEISDITMETCERLEPFPWSLLPWNIMHNRREVKKAQKKINAFYMGV